MNHKKINIHANLNFLRKVNKMTLEEVANKINVSRQTVAKWENGDSIPDLINCAALADLYDVSVDDLLYYDGEIEEISIAPKENIYLVRRSSENEDKLLFPNKLVTYSV